MPDYLLSMQGITKAFPGVIALAHAQLNLREGSIHALMGENGAGKSTLMKCLFGIYNKDGGKIFLHGKEVNFQNPKQALLSGVSMVHQELNQVLERSIIDNIWLGRFPSKGLVVDEKQMLARTKKIFGELELGLDPQRKMSTLSVSERQMVEIAKAVSCEAKVIVLDEPTSSLTETEVAFLFRIIRNLKSKGCGIIYISHKMDEVFEISDEVTVMRDGAWIATEKTCEIDRDKLVSLMVGRSFVNRFPVKDNIVSEEAVFSVKGLKGKYPPFATNISFELKKGEVLGIAGLVGSRRTETLETIFGIRKKECGLLFVDGKPVNNRNPAAAIRNGFSLVTEERRTSGIFGDLSVSFNSTIANMKRYTNQAGVISAKDILKDTGWVVQSMNVKTPGVKSSISNLSGGNQQKVIIGRWLLTNAKIIMLDEPTRGIDVVAKFEIYQLILNLAKEGKGILLVSSEMPELLGITDRILVMSNGRIAGEVITKQTTQEEILSLAAKFL